MSQSPDLVALTQPFESSQIDWRVLESATRNGEVHARVAPFLKVHAIQDRLDACVGPANWRARYTAGPAGGVLCRLEIRVGGEWVGKEDVGEGRGQEAIKAGVSDALKRAARVWGIGRYLAGVGVQWAQIHERGRCRGKAPDGKVFRWDPPALPGPLGIATKTGERGTGRERVA